MSKHWTSGKQSVELRASKIRRDPPPPPQRTILQNARDGETRTVVIGVLAFAIVITFLIFWFSDYTSH